MTESTGKLLNVSQRLAKHVHLGLLDEPVPHVEFHQAVRAVHERRRRVHARATDGLILVRRHDGRFPSSCLGRPLEDILDEIDMTLDEFNSICDRFTNKKIFQRDNRGDLLKDAQGNLTKVNDDNP